MFNPAPRIDELVIDHDQRCYVIDDALLEPDRWIDAAEQTRVDFEMTGHNAYPGLELRMPDAVSERLDQFFAEHIRKLLGVRRTLRMYSRMAMVTLPPEQLQPRQWICHRDRMGMAPDEAAAASVLYLFRDPNLGGTSFYLPRRPIDQIERMIEDSGTMSAADFTAHHGVNAGYPSSSNLWFERVLTVEPKFNRAIFYDGSVFHCSDIPSPALLSDDPRTGRLTFNGFFTCRRVAQ